MNVRKILTTCIMVCFAMLLSLTPVRAEEEADHSYGNPVFTWSEDYSSYTAVLECTNSGCTETKELGPFYLSTIDVETKAATCTEAGAVTYTASFKYEGKSYSDTKTVVIPAAGHQYAWEETAARTKNKEGKLESKCSVCGDTAQTLVTPATSATINPAESTSLISNAAGCTFTIAGQAPKYLSIDQSTGKISGKKASLAKLYKKLKSFKVNVAEGDKTYTVNVKVQIPAPAAKDIKITRKAITIGGVSGYRYSFKYNIKGATRIKVRVKGVSSLNTSCDTYLSAAKSNSNSYLNIRSSLLSGQGGKLTFEIQVYYGKNASEKLVIKK